MRANIYIGLGGSGVKTVDLMKQQFINYDSTYSVNSFLAIDNDIVALHNCMSLSQHELVSIGGERFPYQRYILTKDKYNIPDINVKYLKGIQGHGSGSIRSNGHFCFLCNVDIIRKHILRAYHEVICTNHGLTISGIDVHLFFSLCGGTGSSIFYDVASIVKNIIPNSNIICYVFSHVYFANALWRCEIEANIYASLLEIDACARYLHNRLIYVDNRCTGTTPLANYGIDVMIKQSIEKIFGKSLFIDLPPYERIVDLKSIKESFEICVSNERYSPFSTTVFETLYNSIHHETKIK